MRGQECTRHTKLCGDGTSSANPHWDGRLVLQRLGRDSVSAGGDAEENSSCRISGEVLRRHRNQYFVLRTHTSGTGAAVVSEGGSGQFEFSFHLQAAPVVHTFSAGGDWAGFRGQHPSALP